jgi:beta-lactamase regulating signal transducer with metallopeptidase domain/DUF4097 and DUF4098 domain-containing protein YvlB
MTILKVTLLVLLGFGLAGLLRRASAAQRHLIWTLALAGSVGLAVAEPLLPSIDIRIPAGWLPTAEQSLTQATPFERQPDAVNAPNQERTFNREPGAMVPRNPSPAPRWFDMADLLPLVYLGGVLLVLAWYAMGQVALRRLARTGIELTTPDWLALLERVKADTGVSAPVRLIQSGRVGSPITWGLRRTIIAVPTDARDWDDERRRVVLDHELAHAARGDHLARLIGVIACALYWFHPLLWAAFRRQTIESERAADDHVLVRGTRGPDYAAHLLEIARRSRGLRQAGMVAIGMARHSELEGRLVAALDEQRERRAPRHRVTIMAWIALAGVTLPGAAAHPDLELSPGVLESLSSQPILAVPLAVQTADSVIERTVDAGSGETLELELKTGGDVRIEGWDRSQVRVRARLAGSNWRDTRIEIARTGSGVLVVSEPTQSRENFSTSHDFEIMVPLRYDVRLESAGGGITITQVEGTFRGETGGGDLRLSRIRGEARLSTGGGDIEVSDSDLEGRVRTGGGRVRFSRVTGGIRGSSGSGPVIYSETETDRKGDLSQVKISGDRITVTEGSAGVLHIRKAGGDIVLDGAPNGLDAETGGGDVRIGASRGMVSVSTGGGDITIGPVAGSVRAGTGAGEVRITIVEASGQSQSVEVTAGVGDVVIDWPAGVPARFELETAYTRNFGRRTRIDTGLSLDREETESWDASYGTPRRYVRARGQVGQGGGVVSVRTVNGDITIRTR